MEQIRDGSAPRESGGHETTAEETAVTQGSATDEHKMEDDSERVEDITMEVTDGGNNSIDGNNNASREQAPSNPPLAPMVAFDPSIYLPGSLYLHDELVAEWLQGIDESPPSTEPASSTHGYSADSSDVDGTVYSQRSLLITTSTTTTPMSMFSEFDICRPPTESESTSSVAVRDPYSTSSDDGDTSPEHRRRPKGVKRRVGRKRHTSRSDDSAAKREIEGHRQRKLGPQPTKWVASEETLALSPKLDGLVETAVPKVVVTLGKLPPRDVHQQEAPTDVTLPNPKRRKTIFLDKLPPADVPLLEQSTTRKAAVFHKLLSKNGASMEEPFAVCRTREEESTPSKAAVFNRVMSRRAATSDDPAPKSDAKLGTSAESSKSDDDMEVEGGVVVEPAVPEVTLEISANHVKVKATDRQTEGGEMDVEEEASDPTISTGEVQSEPVAETDVHSPSAASRGCSTPDRLVIVEDPEMSQNVEGIQTPRRGNLYISTMTAGVVTEICIRFASAERDLERNGYS
ncbi:unnamed protein product [Heligmosomoides polygyrus]|uniref:BRCT domain-containing protein n=1 Tax=Heligmosomoides polygyrus TaxID=6339 RepID=A0A3P8AE74_HELPZ|nr:unnamed protein product [Heligmosomoides polygyrus]